MDSNTTFIVFARTVLEMRAEDGVRGIVRERSRFRVHVETAAFAGRELASIQPVDIADWLRDMARKDCADARGPRKLSRATIQRSQALVSAVFTEAVSRGLVLSNPCLGVKVKRKADESATRETWAHLTLDEQKAIAECDSIPVADRLAIRFAIATGLRQGEQFNLEIRDLHVDGDEPHVFVRFGSPNLPPKSGKTRRVPLFGDGVECSREWFEMLPDYAPSNPHTLVFPTARGTRRHEGKPLGRSGTFRKYLRAAGIDRHVRWHDLRHTAATNLVTGVLGRRWTLEEIRPFLGHSSTQITERYSHIGDTDLKVAARETVAVVVPVSVAGPPAVRSYLGRLADRARRLVKAIARPMTAQEQGERA